MDRCCSAKLPARPAAVQIGSCCTELFDAHGRSQVVAGLSHQVLAIPPDRPGIFLAEKSWRSALPLAYRTTTAIHTGQSKQEVGQFPPRAKSYLLEMKAVVERCWAVQPDQLELIL